MAHFFAAYGDSAEFKLVYRLLHGLEIDAAEFIQSRQNRSNLPINTDLSAANLARQPGIAAALQLEPDLPFRQLLWYLRPSSTFLAFDEAVKKWDVLPSLLTPEDQARIPWDSLLETAHRIQHVIEQYIDDYPAAARDKFPLFGVHHGAKSKKAPNTKNPMVSKGSSAFPLYTLTLNDPEPEIHQTASRAQDVHNRLLAFTIIRVDERRNTGRDDKNRRETQFLDPYGFIGATQGAAPDIGKLQNIDRYVRVNCSNGQQALPDIAEIINSGYANFRAQCLALSDNLKKLGTRQNSGDYLVQLLDFFANERRGKDFASPRGKKTNHFTYAGYHKWPKSADLIFTDELPNGTPIARIPLLDEDILSNDADDIAEILGRAEEPQIEIILCDEDDAPHRLILDQHTSHSQLLLATTNQPLWWNQSALSQADIRRFVQHLEVLQAKNEEPPARKRAAILLCLTIQLGMDISRLLELEVVTIKTPNWLTGSTLFQISGQPREVSDTPLRLAFVTGHDLPYWILPLHTPANDKLANRKATSLYYGHTRFLPVADTAQLGEKLRQKTETTDPIGPHPTPCFAQDEKESLQKAFESILKEYRKTHPGFTAGALKRFWYGHLMRQGFPTRFLDFLGGMVPLGRTPRLHYASWPITHSIQGASDQPLPLLKALARAMPLARSAGPDAPDIAYEEFVVAGATGLIRPEAIQKLIQRLKERIQQAPFIVKDMDSLVAFEASFNAYSLYMALWFMLETSHRPHHGVFVDWRHSDHFLHQIVLKDKSNLAGDKYRKSQLSRRLRESMQRYEATLRTFRCWAQDVGLEVPAEQGWYKMNGANQLQIQLEQFDAESIRKLLHQEFPEGIEPNFHRRLIPYLLTLPKDQTNGLTLNFSSVPLEETDIDLWLGHWQHGTAMFHRFSSGNMADAQVRLARRMQEITTFLGLTPCDLALPGFNVRFIKRLREAP